MPKECNSQDSVVTATCGISDIEAVEGESGP